MVRLALGADIPDFSIRLRGYDRTEVEEYLHHSRHGKIGARADGSTPSNDHVQSQVNTLLEEARQQAGEIRGKAEGQARSILEHADRQATATRENADEYARQVRAKTQSHAEVQAAELSASQQKQLARLTELRRDLSDCLLEIGAAAEREPRALVAYAGPLTIPGEAEAKAVPPQTRLQTQSAQAGLGWPSPFGDALALRRSRGVLVGGLACGGVLLLLLVNPFGSSTPVPELVDTGAQSITGGSVATEMSDIPSVPEPVDPTSAPPQPPSATVEPVSRASVLAAPPADAGLMVTLRAERQCWISIVVDGGERLERLMEPEETIVLHAQDEALVQVGNAAALSVLINNTQTKPLGRDGEVVTMRINHETYRSYFPDHL